jgi:hypothetical protein
MKKRPFIPELLVAWYQAKTDMLVGMPHLSLLDNDFSSASTLRVIFRNFYAKKIITTIVWLFIHFTSITHESTIPLCMKPAAENLL